MILLNAFSANMLEEFPVSVRFTEIDFASFLENLARAVDAGAGEILFQSAVGHADTAAVFSNVLGIPVPCNRVNVSLKKGDMAVLGQYSGPRLPEGATELPEGATIKWLMVEVV